MPLGILLSQRNLRYEICPGPPWPAMWQVLFKEVGHPVIHSILSFRNSWLPWTSCHRLFFSIFSVLLPPPHTTLCLDSKWHPQPPLPFSPLVHSLLIADDSSKGVTPINPLAPENIWKHLQIPWSKGLRYMKVLWRWESPGRHHLLSSLGKIQAFFFFFNRLF